LPQTKCNQLLEACTSCFGQKLSWQTAGRGGRKKASAKDNGARKLEESSESNEVVRKVDRNG